MIFNTILLFYLFMTTLAHFSRGWRKRQELPDPSSFDLVPAPTSTYDEGFSINDVAVPSMSPSASGTPMTCDIAMKRFSNRMNSCLRPFYSTRPDTIPAANSLGFTMVQCMCGACMNPLSGYYEFLFESHQCTLGFNLNYTQMERMEKACHMAGGIDGLTVLKVMNVQAYLKDGSSYIPLSMNVYSSQAKLETPIMFWLLKYLLFLVY